MIVTQIHRNPSGAISLTHAEEEDWDNVQAEIDSVDVRIERDVLQGWGEWQHTIEVDVLHPQGHIVTMHYLGRDY